MKCRIQAVNYTNNLGAGSDKYVRFEILFFTSLQSNTKTFQTFKH